MCTPKSAARYINIVSHSALCCSFIFKVLSSLRKNEWALKAGQGIVDVLTSALVSMANGSGNATPLRVDWTPACNGGVAIVQPNAGPLQGEVNF